MFLYPGPSFITIRQFLHCLEQCSKGIVGVRLSRGANHHRICIHIVLICNEVLVFPVSGAVKSPVFILQIQHYRHVILCAYPLIIEVVVPETINIEMPPASVACRFQRESLQPFLVQHLFPVLGPIVLLPIYRKILHCKPKPRSLSGYGDLRRGVHRCSSIHQLDCCVDFLFRKEVGVLSLNSLLQHRIIGRAGGIDPFRPEQFLFVRRHADHRQGVGFHPHPVGSRADLFRPAAILINTGGNGRGLVHRVRGIVVGITFEEFRRTVPEPIRDRHILVRFPGAALDPDRSRIQPAVFPRVAAVGGVEDQRLRVLSPQGHLHGFFIEPGRQREFRRAQRRFPLFRQEVYRVRRPRRGRGERPRVFPAAERAAVGDIKILLGVLQFVHALPCGVVQIERFPVCAQRKGSVAVAGRVRRIRPVGKDDQVVLQHGAFRKGPAAWVVLIVAQRPP